MSMEFCYMCEGGKGRFRELRRCSIGHAFHQSCLERTLKKRFLYSFISECNSCISELIPYVSSGKATACLKCKCKLNDKRQYCILRDNFCEICFWNHFSKSHFITCESCRDGYNHLIPCIQCSLMTQPDDIRQSEICINHNCCTTCINKAANCRINCKGCQEYFTSSKYTATCILCRGNVVQNVDFLCESGHYFCKICLANYSGSRFNCIKCYELLDRIEEGNRAKYIDNLGHGLLDRTLKPPYLNYCSACNKNKINLSRYPNCSKHSYCMECINLPKSTQVLSLQRCEQCDKCFNMLTKVYDTSTVIICNICGAFPEGTNCFCESKHCYCKNCMKFLVENKVSYLKLLSCDCCIRALNKIKLAPTIKSTSFSCGHSFTQEELKNFYLKKLQKFLTRLSNKNLDKLKTSWTIKCKRSNNCVKALRIPFKLMENEISRILGPEQLSVLDIFELYFEGAPCKFEMCLCGQIICAMGGVRFNCRC